MADETPKSTDLWAVLDDATQAVESWPAWKQKYEADVYYDASPRRQPAESE